MKISIYILLSISTLLFSCKNTQSTLQNAKESQEEKGGNIALYYELVHEAEFYYERDRRFGFGGCAFKYKLRKGEELSTVKEALAKEGFILHKKLDSETAYFKQ